MTKNYDPITDAFDRGRMAERTRIKSLLEDALNAINEIQVSIEPPKKNRGVLSPETHTKKEVIWGMH